jgi:hypothetical protein
MVEAGEGGGGGSDTLDTRVIFYQPPSPVYAARYINICGGSGESANVKVDISDLIGPNGVAPTSTAIMEMSWAVQGFTAVRLFWDHSTDDEIAALTGVGSRSYREIGGLRDPKSAGGTGDILLSTDGTTSGFTYDIALVIEMRN